tara:strand:+ start:48 stop:374 length:327 start_codon:yes stop_codon:yes gene_type:complete
MNNSINLKITEIKDDTSNNKKVSFDLEQNETFYYKKYLGKQHNTVIDTYNNTYNNRKNNNDKPVIPFISNTNYTKNNKVFSMQLIHNNINNNNINHKSKNSFSMKYIK